MDQLSEISSFRVEDHVVRVTLERPFASQQFTTLHLAKISEGAQSSHPRKFVVKLIRFLEVDHAKAIEKAEKFIKQHWDDIGPRNKRLVDLDDPNVVRYFVADIIKPVALHDALTARLIMEYCSDKDLAHALDQDTFDLEKIVYYTRQILSGLSYLHSVRTIHGDIKPHNIFLTTEKSKTVLKLGDLDDRVQLVKTVTGSEVKQATGTLLYMSPEMIHRDFQTMENKSGITFQPGRSTDIWSTGCVVLDMFMVSKGKEWRCISKPHPSMPDVPEGLLAFVKKSPSRNDMTVALQLGSGAAVDDQFLRYYIIREGTGFEPKYPSDTPVDLREFLDQCFQINPGCRPTAEKLSNHHFVNKEKGG